MCRFHLLASLCRAAYLGVLLSGALILDTTVLPLPAQAQVAAQDDAIDVQRAERYAARLRALEKARDGIRDQAASLAALNPNLQQDLQNALRTSLVAAGVLEATPPVSVTPTLVQGWGAYRGTNGQTVVQPELMLWYTLQDNTLFRASLLQSLAGSQRSAAQSYASLQANLATLEQIARSADENFLEFRELSDLLGRRSPRELEEAERLATEWLQNDPLDVGAALVCAQALRSVQRYDECDQLLDSVDHNFPAMQAIHAAVAAQVAFLSGDIEQAKRDLARGITLSRSSGAGEPYLIYGWLCMAEQNWGQAKTYATRLKTLAPDDLETAILEALSTAYDRPKGSRDALQILRRARLNTSPDDWHYHEALAIVHSMARDHQSARREIADAIAVAPSHIRADLEREQQDFLAGKTPNIDWQLRLTRQWLPAK